MDQLLHSAFLLMLSMLTAFHCKSHSPNHTQIHTALLSLPKGLSNIHTHTCILIRVQYLAQGYLSMQNGGVGDRSADLQTGRWPTESQPLHSIYHEGLLFSISAPSIQHCSLIDVSIQQYSIPSTIVMHIVSSICLSSMLDPHTKACIYTAIKKNLLSQKKKENVHRYMHTLTFLQGKLIWSGKNRLKMYLLDALVCNCKIGNLLLVSATCLFLEASETAKVLNILHVPLDPKDVRGTSLFSLSKQVKGLTWPKQVAVLSLLLVYAACFSNMSHGAIWPLKDQVYFSYAKWILIFSMEKSA